MDAEHERAAQRDWAQVKSLWFAVQDADESAQAELLSDSAVPEHVRLQVQEMMRAAERIDERFEKPAMISLGIDAFSEPAVPTLIGQRVGHYEIVRRVGQGGMGAVYEAVRADDAYRHRVAIKTIWRGADSDVLLQRFRSERQILASLQHPNIAQLIDGGATAEGMPWLAMEFVDGMPIDEYCDSNSLAIPARIDLFRQVCAAVQYAHTRLVIHRDLKPNNVLVTTDGTVKLLDFGVAKLLDDVGEGTLTGAGLSPFTAAYAAPEQADGSLISTATDVYALGALLVTLLAGDAPIRLADLSAVERLDAVRHGVPRLPSAIARENDSDLAGRSLVAEARGGLSTKQLVNTLRGELDAISQMALRREPERRYGSALALSDDLHRYLRRERVHARPDTLSYRAWATFRRKAALFVGGAAVTATILIASTVSLYQARAMRAEAKRSERVGAFMSGMAMGPGSVTTDPVIRIGPQGTVADLLDSALARVPTEFANDSRTRIRLYTAIGLNYFGQARYTAARFVLDSALVLSRTVYGEKSAEYARVLLETANIRETLDGPAGVDSLMQVISRLVEGTRTDTGAIYTGRMLLLAQDQLARGNIRAADSIARAVRALELNAGSISMVRARADAVILRASSWLHRDPRTYARGCEALIALTDSLRAPLSPEREFGAGCLSFALLVLGRTDEADRVLNENMPPLEQNFGKVPLFAATLTVARASVAAARGDSATRHAQVAQAWRLMSGMADIPAADRLGLGQAVIEDAWSRNSFAEARDVAASLSEILSAKSAPLYSVFAYLYLGLAEQQMKNWPAAETAFRHALLVLPSSGDLNSMFPRLRRPLADVVANQGRSSEADSIRALDPALAAMPRCTPGGDWRGCRE